MEPILLFSHNLKRIAQALNDINISPNRDMAIFISEKSRPDFVYHTAQLENNLLSFPEVKKLIDGITVGGRKIEDVEQVLRLNEALSYVVGLVKKDSFTPSKEVAKNIQKIVAEKEALEVGKFRSGQVYISGTNYIPPSADRLHSLFEDGIHFLNNIENIIERAFVLFLWGAYMQFFYDGNKRTARLLCNGILLSNGYPPMLIRAEEQGEYNRIMVDFYNSGDATDAMIWFIERYRERIKQFGLQ